MAAEAVAPPVGAGDGVGAGVLGPTDPAVDGARDGGTEPVMETWISSLQSLLYQWSKA